LEIGERLRSLFLRFGAGDLLLVELVLRLGEVLLAVLELRLRRLEVLRCHLLRLRLGDRLRLLREDDARARVGKLRLPQRDVRLGVPRRRSHFPPWAALFRSVPALTAPVFAARSFVIMTASSASALAR